MNTEHPTSNIQHSCVAALWLRLFALAVRCWLLVAGCFLVFSATRADTILGSKHDLSVAGGGPVKAMTESEVCLFCHTPHRGTGQTPLWNHTMSGATYTPYYSSTIKATVGQPSGSSKLCLSCHDGTVALGMVHSRTTPIEMQGGITTLPPGRTQIGTDLSDDHPISFTYDNALAAANGQLKPPSTLTGKVRLDLENQLQCTACHDPHDNKWGKFLVQENYASSLCVSCHEMSGWQNTSHRTSAKTWNGAGTDPWPHSDYTTVAANACGSCHASHGAKTQARLLNQPGEEQNCFACHNGNVAQKNIQTEFNKFSAHPVLTTSDAHDPMEDPFTAPRHTACSDCHNSHASRATTATAPNASGALAEVAGVNASGAFMNAVSAEYELCFRCHADSANRGPARVPRVVTQTNTRLEFSPANASFHPVESARRNPNVPSLLSPLTPSSVIYCTDCHNNDQGTKAGGSGANGPHGSAYEPILERELVWADFTPESASSYALCYKCHSRDSLLNDESFPLHKKHVVDHQTACTTCHDSHGVANNKHLINFNSTYVTSFQGQINFTSTGVFRGNCTLTCHGKEHDAAPYGN